MTESENPTTPLTEEPVVEEVSSAKQETVEDIIIEPSETLSQTPNNVQSDSYEKPISEGHEAPYHLSLPSLPFNKFTEIVNNIKAEELDISNPNINVWKRIVEEALNFYTTAGLYQDRFDDSNSVFRQGVLNKDDILKTMSPLKFKSTAGELKGDMAVLRISAMLGLGDVVNVPLPHSGFWVAIKPPNESDLIDFYNNIFKEKIMLGRMTNGLTLTNFSVYINQKLFAFIQKHIHSISNKDITVNELGNYLLIHDFYILAWGFISTIYPNGFDYQRVCTSNVEACQHVVNSIINMQKLLWIDNSSLTEAQKNILSENRANVLGIESYRKYIAEHTRTITSDFKLNENILFKLKVPTFNEYVADGMDWINGVNNMIDSLVIETEDTENTRSEALNQYVKSSMLRQFSHFIDQIDIQDSSINDRETVNKTLTIFSSDDNIRVALSEKILEFKSKTTLALIGIPEYDCPVCHQPQNTTPVNNKLVSVIPLDVMQTFFTLLTLRISKILEREY